MKIKGKLHLPEHKEKGWRPWNCINIIGFHYLIWLPLIHTKRTREVSHAIYELMAHTSFAKKMTSWFSVLYGNGLNYAVWITRFLCQIFRFGWGIGREEAGSPVFCFFCFSLSFIWPFGPFFEQYIQPFTDKEKKDIPLFSFTS